jgi:hypothetical protein
VEASRCLGTVVAPGSAAHGGLTADDETLTFFTDDLDHALDVCFDGHRVWSVTPRALDETADGWRTVSWPQVLATRLEGTALVELRRHASDAVVAAARIVFGSGEGRVDLTDDYGRPLSLSKWGRLNQSFADLDPEVLEWYLDRTQDVLEVLATDLGLPAFLAYGSLLGAARSGRFIGHDMDVDLAYLSGQTTPATAMLESFRVERELRKRGWHVRRQNGGFLQVFFVEPAGALRNIDVFTMFRDPAGGMLYGLNDTFVPAVRDDVLPVGAMELEGRSLPVPRQPDVLLEAAYGPGWRVPDPGFHYGMSPEKRRLKDWFSGYRRDRDLWTSLYRHHPGVVSGKPTDFARWALGTWDDPGAVIDLGCGMGRDTFFYSEAVGTAVGIDAAGSAVRRAVRRDRRRRKRGDDPTSFTQVNLCSLRDAAAAGALMARRTPGRRALAANHLLDAVSPSAVPHFWTLATMLAGGGGRCTMEFCAAQTPGEFTEFPGMPRRVVRPDEVREQAAMHGASVVHAEQVHGVEGVSWRMVVEWT